jgi:hypothetical protein
MGTSPVGVSASELSAQGWAAASLVVVVHISYTVVCLLKGKIVTGLAGLPIPLVSLVGAIRLAKPASFWAKRYYSAEKAERSAGRFGQPYAQRLERIRQMVSGGGRPD